MYFIDNKSTTLKIGKSKFSRLKTLTASELNGQRHDKSDLVVTIIIKLETQFKWRFKINNI